MTKHRHYPVTKAEREQRATGWDNPRDDQRDPEPYDPNMDRWAIGSNDPDYRRSK